MTHSLSPVDIDLETGEILGSEDAAKVTGTDGKSYPARKPNKPHPGKTREAVAARWAKIAELAATGQRTLLGLRTTAARLVGGGRC